MDSNLAVLKYLMSVIKYLIKMRSLQQLWEPSGPLLWGVHWVSMPSCWLWRGCRVAGIALCQAAGSRQLPNRSTPWHSQALQWYLKGNTFKEGHKMLSRGEWERQCKVGGEGGAPWWSPPKGAEAHGRPMLEDIHHERTCCPWIHPCQNRGNK